MKTLSEIAVDSQSHESIQHTFTHQLIMAPYSQCLKPTEPDPSSSPPFLNSSPNCLPQSTASNRQSNPCSAPYVCTYVDTLYTYIHTSGWVYTDVHSPCTSCTWCPGGRLVTPLPLEILQLALALHCSNTSLRTCTHNNTYTKHCINLQLHTVTSTYIHISTEQVKLHDHQKLKLCSNVASSRYSYSEVLSS